MSRGNAGHSSGGMKSGDSAGGRASRGPGVSSLNPNNKIPPLGNNSRVGAGYNSNQSNPYALKPLGSGASGTSGAGTGAKKAGSSLNTNVFNIPKYG